MGIISAVCFIWIGVALDAPFWYYLLIGIGVLAKWTATIIKALANKD